MSHKIKIKPYDDPNHERNSSKHHTGQLCIEGCGKKAGTAWSPHWCQECNAKRIRKINSQFAALRRGMKP